MYLLNFGYHNLRSGLGDIPECKTETASCAFVSCTNKTSTVKSVNKAHWLEWLSAPLDFAAALECATRVALGCTNFKGLLCTIELGAHPVLLGAAVSVSSEAFDTVHASTMRRGVPGAAYIKQQRDNLRKMEAFSGLTISELVLPSGKNVLCGIPFAEQGITSAQHPLLTAALRGHFPGIGPHDFYRYTSLPMLCSKWDTVTQTTSVPLNSASAAALEVRKFSERCCFCTCNLVFPKIRCIIIKPFLFHLSLCSRRPGTRHVLQATAKLGNGC
eukprot:SAG25_NODE_742_length_5598_cov_36.107110_4_plen_273_part_00